MRGDYTRPVRSTNKFSCLCPDGYFEHDPEFDLDRQCNNEDGFWIARNHSIKVIIQITPTIKIGTNVTKYLDTGLEPETTYYYIIASVRGSNVSPSPEETSATTNPYPPENLQATALSSSEVKLTWTNRSKVADLIMIERRTGNGNYGKVYQKEQ